MSSLTSDELEWLLAEQTWKLNELASDRAEELVSIAGWQRSMQRSVDKVLSLHSPPKIQAWGTTLACNECRQPYPCRTVEALR